MPVALAGLATLSWLPHASAQTAEVIHWWTSQGESAAAQVPAKAYRAAGGEWIGTAIAGPENGRSITVNRIVGGRPPTVAQFNPSQQYRELIAEGLLADVDAVAVATPSNIVATAKCREAASPGYYTVTWRRGT